METQIKECSRHQADNFSSFIKQLIEKFDPEQIYSFGQNVSISVNESCFAIRQTKEKYHYFLLMVMNGACRAEYEIQDFANHHCGFATVTILAHTSESIRVALEANNRFFLTVCSTGHIVYSRDGMMQRIPTQNIEETEPADKTRKAFMRRFSLASGFLDSAKECLMNEHYNLSVFMAHQVVEQCCIALLKVHLGYRSNIHNLYRLLRLCDCFSQAPSNIFLSGRDEDSRLLEIMVKSYSATRYKDDFELLGDDAEQIYIRVSTFLKLTEMLCEEKVNELQE